ncbi:MAG: hypothetical protein PIR02_16120 [Microbacterium enclense]
MSHPTQPHRGIHPGAIGAVILLAVMYALLLGFIALVGLAPLLALAVAVIVAVTLTVIYVRTGPKR